MALANLFRTRKWQCYSLYKYIEGNIKFFSMKGTSTNSLLNMEDITQDLKLATNARQVLDMVSIHLPQFQSIHVMQTLKTLFNLHKQGSPEEVIYHEDFVLLCKKLKKECRSMDINDVIDALKILAYLGVPCNSIINQTLLQLIKHSVNTLSLQHVIFLDFLLQKFDKPTPMVEALLIALPLVFQLQLQTVIDHENINELVEYLQYAAKQAMPPNCIQSIVSALTLHGEDLPVFAAKSVIWSLSDLPNFEITHCRLLENALKILKQNIMTLSYDEINTTVSKMLHCYVQDNQNFYDEELFDKCAQYMIVNKCDFMKVIWMMKKLIRLGHINLPILDYLGEMVVEKPELLSNGRPVVLFTIIASYSHSDYKPKNWEIIKKAILDNELLTNGKDEFPWTKCVVEMASLDCYDDNLLKRIFSPTFLQKYLAREFNVLDHFQLLHIHQAVKTLHKSYTGPFLSPDVVNHAVELYKQTESPIKSALIKAFENEKFIANGLLSSLDHYIDHVIVMRNGKPIPICPAVDQDIKYVEDILIPQDSTIICIICLHKGCYATNCLRLKGSVQLCLRTLEALDYKVLPISIQIWKNLHDREKIPYLLQKVNDKCM